MYMNPLRLLYFYGPSLSGWGFWEGTGASDACSAITTVPASFWADGDANTQACDAVLERKFAAFVIGSVGVGAVICCVLLCFGIISYCTTTRPLMRALREAKGDG
jgi:hypothetical protein